MSYIGQGLPADSFQGFTTDTFTGDGSATTFTLSKEPFSADSLIVVVDNVIQQPTTNFTVSGTTLTIVGTAILSGIKGYAIHTGGPLPIGGASELDLNGASDKLILDADADTTISADTDDQIDFKLGGVDEMTMSSSGIVINEGSNDRDFRVESNSNTHMLFVDGGNNLIGINDSSPSSYYYNDLVVNSGDEGGITIVDTSSGQSALAFADGTSGTARYSGRVLYDHNTDKIQIGSGGNTPLVVEPGGQTNTNSSEHNNTAFEVKHTGDGSSSYPYGMAIRFQNANRDNNTEYFHYAIDSAGLKFVVYSDGDVKNHDNSYGSTSDERIKQDIRNSNSQWDDIKAVKVRNFKKKDDVRQYGDKAWEQIGVIAQELEDAGMDKLIKHSDPTAGDIASDSSFGTVDEDGKITVKEQVKGVSYSVLYMKAIKALQEAQTRIETLETKVKALEDA